MKDLCEAKGQRKKLDLEKEKMAIGVTFKFSKILDGRDKKKEESYTDEKRKRRNYQNKIKKKKLFTENVEI